MNNKKIYSVITITFLVSFLFIFFSQINKQEEARDVSNLAQINPGEYVPLEKIEGLSDNNNGDITNYLKAIYKWGVSLAVALSIIMIIVGGIQYMSTDAISGKSQGKEKIKGAVAGLLLALSSYLILKTINPQLVNLEGVQPQEIDGSSR